MKFVNLSIENIKKIKVIDITPGKDGVVILEGRNAQGKSSVMDSISMLVGGEKLIPLDPVRHGEDRAKIKAKIGDPLNAEVDGMIITRTFKANGFTKLEIKRKDGELVRSPQEWLNARLKLITLDPSEFMRMRPVERVEELKKIPGLDCTKEDAAYMVEYDKRTLVNRDLDTAKKSLTEYDGLIAPKELRTVAQIQKEIDAVEEKNKGIRAANKVIDDKQAEFDKLKTEHDHIGEKKVSARAAWETALDDIKDTEERIKELQAKIVRLNESIEVHKKEVAGHEAAMDMVLKSATAIKKDIELSMRVPELSTVKLKEELVAASEVTGINEKLSRKAKLESDIGKHEEEVLSIEKVMVGIKEKKRAKLAAFKLPVDGLEVGERDIMFSGIPFGNLSTAQQLTVSAAIAVAEKPTLQLMMLREASLFDDQSMKQITEFCQERDIDIWYERVANSPSGDALYIEDGEVLR